MDRNLARVTLGSMQNPVRGLLNAGAAVASVVGAGFLWARSTGDLTHLTAILIFALSLVALYTVSSLYHSVPWQSVWKQRMQRLDHSMIYVLVAGTYTPLAYVVLEGWLRPVALCTVWGIALVGILQKVFVPQLSHAFSITMQTTQGWLALLLLAPLSERLPEQALLLGALGGAAYTVGMLLFVLRRPRLWPRVFSHHEVFHLFVVTGSSLHYAMTFAYVARFPGT